MGHCALHLARIAGRTCQVCFGVRGMMLVAALSLVGCRSYFPAEVKRQVSEAGAIGLSYGGTRHVSYLITTQFIAGRSRTYRALQQHARCGKDAPRIHVRWRDPRIDPDQAEELCHWISAAASFVAGYSHGRNIGTIHVDIIGVGEKRDARWLSVAVPGKLSMRLAVRWLVDKEHRATEAVSQVAHELTHVDAHFLMPGRDNDTEELAYLAGACAQWRVVGVLATRDLIAGPLQGGEDVFRRSSQVAHRIWSLLHHFVAATPLTGSSPQAAEFSALCENRLRAGFALPRDH